MSWTLSISSCQNVSEILRISKSVSEFDIVVVIFIVSEWKNISDGASASEKGIYSLNLMSGVSFWVIFSRLQNVSKSARFSDWWSVLEDIKISEIRNESTCNIRFRGY